MARRGAARRSASNKQHARPTLSRPRPQPHARARAHPDPGMGPAKWCQQVRWVGGRRGPRARAVRKGRLAAAQDGCTHLEPPPPGLGELCRRFLCKPARPEHRAARGGGRHPTCPACAQCTHSAMSAGGSGGKSASRALGRCARRTVPSVPKEMVVCACMVGRLPANVRLAPSECPSPSPSPFPPRRERRSGQTTPGGVLLTALVLPPRVSAQKVSIGSCGANRTRAGNRQATGQSAVEPWAVRWLWWTTSGGRKFWSEKN